MQMNQHPEECKQPWDGIQLGRLRHAQLPQQLNLIDLSYRDTTRLPL